MWFPPTYISCIKLIKGAISLCGWNVWHIFPLLTLVKLEFPFLCVGEGLAFSCYNAGCCLISSLAACDFLWLTPLAPNWSKEQSPFVVEMFGTTFVDLPLDCTCETYCLCVGESGCSAGFCCFVGASKECVNTQWDCFLLTNIKQYPRCCTPSYLLYIHSK